MQSIASLMSIGKTDIGNLEDIEDEENDLNLSNKISEIASQFKQLENSGNHGNPFGDPDDVECDDNIGIVALFLLLNLKILNIRTHKKFAVITLKFKQECLTIE